MQNKCQRFSYNDIESQTEYIERVKSYYEQKGKTPLANILTFGCQQNENDSERIRGILKMMGFDFTDDNEKADLILYNTCAVREGAEDRVLGNLGALKHLAIRKPDILIGICGCMMQQEHMVKRLKAKYKHVNVIFGTHTLYKLPQILSDAIESNTTVINVENIHGDIIEDIPVYREASPKAWVSIMYGCNNFCSYCIVPYTRGRERSRKCEDVLKDVKNLVKEGVTEITLLGQNVNSYGKDLEENIDFADLLRKVNKIDGLKRIRFMTSHPKDITDKLIDAMADCEKVCNQLHLPFQAGSNRILDKMNRKYTKEDYLALVQKIRTKMPDISLSSDVIVGFPNETKEDFNETIDVLEKVRFDTIFSFIYSKRSGTPAAVMEDSITDEEKHKNFDRLLEVQNRISREINETYGGKIVEVLVEGPSKTNSDILAGRTDTGKTVNFPASGNVKVGDYVNIKITKVNTWSLDGEIINK